MAFADITATPYTADTPFWEQPDARVGDDLVLPQPTGDLADGGSYGDIPQAFNGRFEEHPDTPPDSVPQALRPADPYFTAATPGEAPFQHKDAD